MVLSFKDVNIRGRKVFMRIDINVPIDPRTGSILDDKRIKAHVKAVKVIVEEYNPALVLASHQGRPGDSDFTTLEKHAELLSKYTGLDVEFIPDVIGPAALSKIKSMKPGDIILLDNLRLLAEENIEAPPERQAQTIFAKRIASVIDFYINDAFSAAHRSQPSIVGLPLLVPGVMGPTFESEVKALSRVFSESATPRVFVLGGKKVAELLVAIEKAVKNGVVIDSVLTGGLLAHLFLLAKGVDIGRENVKVLEKLGLLHYVHKARELLEMDAPIDVPIDFVVKTSSGYEVREIDRIGDGVIVDIGPTTVSAYEERLKHARTVVMRGPLGVIEDPETKKGTERIIRAALTHADTVIIAGGHLTSLISESKFDNSRVYISLGGNATMLFLAGERLPAIEALEISAKKFFGVR
jgi:phosphoglycerate kinase